MMIAAIWSMSKHPWWWLLQFDPCPSILDYVDWDFINVQAYLMMMGVWSMYKYPCWWSSGFNPCLKTNFLSSWPKFGHDDNSNCHHDQIFVTMTKNWSRDNSNCHRDQFFVIVTKFLSRWQKIGHATKKKKNTERKALFPSVLPKIFWNILLLIGHIVPQKEGHVYSTRFTTQQQKTRSGSQKAPREVNSSWGR